ncbi:MAG: outer membrane receptor protein, partial [Muribaculaceae bacterium]|nr:outer membrane receptor protein [Muribaculaceae bacterium]
GVECGRQVVNFDAGYLDSRTDPRDPRENYKRINGSVRAHLKSGSEGISNIAADWAVGVDYAGSFDNVKPDPDLNYNKIDEYESSYNRWAFTSDMTLNFQKQKLFSSVALNTSLSYQHDRLTRRKQVAPQRASVAPSGMTEGVHDGHYLLSEYIADYVSDGRPLSLFLKLRISGKLNAGRCSHGYKAGCEWSLAKNYGDGQVYDLMRPLSAAWTTRPRAYRDIPGLRVINFYVEDNMHVGVAGGSSLDFQAGVRSIGLMGLDRRFRLSGKTYLDPRLNAVFNFPAFEAGGSSCHLLVAGGYGLTTKMPTVDYLYPQAHFNDMIQLNYYDAVNPMGNSRVNLRTYIEDPTNYNLRAARNHKWEIRAGASCGGNSVSITLFSEHMGSGYRYSAVYAPYALRRYDASDLASAELNAPPALESLPYEDINILDGYRRVTNGSRIDKRGVEYQLNTVRVPSLCTALIVNGAWFRSRYSNSQMLFSPVTDVVGGTAVSDVYVGLYDTDDGRINEQFNTNFMFDTQIPRWGLVFSTSIQCMWYLKTTRLRDNGTPAYYMAAYDGMLHPYTPAESDDVMLQYLVKHYNDAAYRTQTVPPAVYVNHKA